MAFPWLAVQVGASLAFLIGEQIYHRGMEKTQPRRKPRRELDIPVVEIGTPVPMVYGRVKARSPLLVWASTPEWTGSSYGMNMFFVVGMAIDNGNGTSRLHGMWAGDWPLLWSDPAPVQTGVGGPETPITVIGTGRNGEDLGTGFVEFLNGNPSQVLANDGETSADAFTFAGRKMLLVGTGGGAYPVEEIGGYRGYLCVLLHGIGDSWLFGTSPTVPAYAFDIETYQDGNGFPATGVNARIGSDLNPVNALFDLIVNKAGIDVSYVDFDSFVDAAAILKQEGNGYSRFINSSAELAEHVQEILRQIDGALYVDESTGKIALYLVRNNYLIDQIPHITKDNCISIDNFAMSGWTNIINKVRLVFTNRANGYAEESITEQNDANAVGQDGIENELVIEMPGIHEEGNARRVAQRELSFHSRPVMKCRAILDRTFASTLHPGAPVRLTWKGPDVAGVVFRVVGLDKGKLEDGRVIVDLLQDHFWNFRQLPPQPGGWEKPDVGGTNLTLG